MSARLSQRRRRGLEIGPSDGGGDVSVVLHRERESKTLEGGRTFALASRLRARQPLASRGPRREGRRHGSAVDRRRARTRAGLPLIRPRPNRTARRRRGDDLRERGGAAPRRGARRASRTPSRGAARRRQAGSQRGHRPALPRGVAAAISDRVEHRLAARRWQRLIGQPPAELVGTFVRPRRHAARHRKDLTELRIRQVTEGCL